MTPSLALPSTLPAVQPSPSSPDDSAAKHTTTVTAVTEILASALVDERGHPDTWRPTPRHPGLALAVIDAVMTPGIRVETVAGVCRRYADLFPATDGAPELAASFVLLTPHEWASLIGTWHRTSRRDGAPYKAEIVLQAAELLTDKGVHTSRDLLDRATDDDLRAAWLQVPGQSTGSTWRHLLLTAGYDQPMVCPLTRRFVRRALGACPADEEILRLTHSVAALLDVAPLDIDHQMWRAGSGPRRRFPQESDGAGSDDPTSVLAAQPNGCSTDEGDDHGTETGHTGEGLLVADAVGVDLRSCGA